MYYYVFNMYVNFPMEISNILFLFPWLKQIIFAQKHILTIQMEVA